VNRVARLPERRPRVATNGRSRDVFIASLRALLEAPTKADAIGVAVELCSAEFDAPAAAWVCQPDHGFALLAAAAGLPQQVAVRVEDEMSLIDWVEGPIVRRLELVDRFAKIVQAPDAFALEVGDVLLVAAAIVPGQESREQIESLLASVFELREHKDISEKRVRNLDLGLALTAHELRAPLLAAKAAIEVSHLHVGGEHVSVERPRDMRHGLLSRAQRELELLADMCESLLVWAAGECSVDLTPMPIVEAVSAAVEECSLHPGKGTVMFASVDDDLLVDGSAFHLRIAVSNLIRNALNFAPFSEPVFVLLESSGDKARISVKDRGPGVPPDELKVVFDPFTRGVNGQAPRGAGLGLFIAKKIVEGHGGRIYVESSAGGATFIIEIPTVDVNGGRP